MNKKIPKIYVNNIKNINNNDKVYYSMYDKNTYSEEINEVDIQKRLNELFKSNDFVYKKKIHIKTKYEEKDFIIVSKNIDYLLTIEGKRIYISDIINII